LIGRFVRLVAERDRLADLDSVAEWYGKLEDQAAGRVRVAITSPAALSDADVSAICKAFRGIAGGEVTASVSTDAGLLGGAIVELQGRVFDGSIKSALTRLASRMAGTR
jgi:F-type H+-transporting ATPase subunit delta